jgi:hypothetical protein
MPLAGHFSLAFTAVFKGEKDVK